MCEGDGEPPFWLCRSCMAQLQLVDPWDRCRRCFSPEGAPLCLTCTESAYTARGALLSASGVAAPLIERLAYQPHPRALSLLANLIIVQWERLHWPRISTILLSPSSRYNRYGRLLQELYKLLAQRWNLAPRPQPGARVGLLTVHLHRLAGEQSALDQARSVYALALLD
jgi:hypothetical protein